MRVLVTGGAGFIGGHVAGLFGDVAVLDDLSGGYWRNIPDGAAFYHGSLVDAAKTDWAIRNFRPEVIIHAAAYAAEGLSHWMRRYCFEQNLISWANLANAAVRHDVRRIVALSSMSVYGSQQVPFSEDLIPAPEDPYGASKAAIETDLRALGAVQGTEWIIVRPHNVYGPRQNLSDPYRNVVAIFMRQALAGEPLTVFGDGQQTRAFSYIGDVAPAIAKLAIAPEHNYIVNVGGEEPIPILTLAQRVLEATGASSPVVHLPTRYEVRDAWCRHDVLRAHLGDWQPTDMTTGLAAMADWAADLELAPLRRYDYEVERHLYSAWRR